MTDSISRSGGSAPPRSADDVLFDDETRLLREAVSLAEVLLIVLDRTGCIRAINPFGCELLGGTRAELIGRAWFESFLPLEEQAAVRKVFEALVDGASVGMELYVNDIITLDGTRRTVRWHNGIIRDDEGRVSSVLSSGTDITQREHDAAELRASRKLLEDMRTALDQASIVATTDHRGLITYVNDKFCEISGYDRAELLGQDHRIVNSGFHPTEFWHDLWSTISRGSVWRGRVRNRAKGGSIYWVDTTIVPFRDESGKPYQYMAVRTDITEYVHAEERLRRESGLAQVGRMAAVVAHEVRNPLAGVSGALQVLRSRFDDDATEQQILGEMLARIGVLNARIADLLQFARPRDPDFVPVDVLDLARRAVARCVDDHRFEDVEIITHGESVQVVADTALLADALFNLLINAAQAMSEGGRIEIHVRSDGAGCSIAVSDEGPGVPANQREHIFEAFHTTRPDGTGLGLAIVARAVEMHGGHVRLATERERSRTSGTGATFIISLPFDERAARAASPAQGYRPPAANGGNGDGDPTHRIIRELAHALRNPIAGIGACIQNLRRGVADSRRCDDYYDAMMQALDRMGEAVEAAVAKSRGHKH